MTTFSVKNFDKFQHYKDRSPPWIKLYNETLEDYELAALPDVMKAHLVLIWLLASRMENKLPWDARWIAGKINATEPVDLDGLAAAGFIVPYEPEVAKGKREDWASRYIPDSVRDSVMARDNNRCVQCQADKALEIDHIIPISKGGTGDPDNLQVLCRSCNRKKRAKLVAQDSRADAEQVATQMRSPERERETEERQSREEENIVGSADADPHPADAGSEGVHPEGPRPKAPTYPSEFDELWNDYRGVCDAARAEPGSKKNAFERWRKLSAEDRQRCFEGVMAYTVWRFDRADTPGLFTAQPKHFERFISGRLWETYQSEAA